MLLLALKHHALNNNNNISQRNLVEWKYQVAENKTFNESTSTLNLYSSTVLE